MFLSPSGNGLKLLFKIDPELHLASFKGIEKYLKETYDLSADPSGKDVSRACFISYDPDLHKYESAEKFKNIVQDEVTVNTETGEVFEKSSGSRGELPPKLRKSLDRAEYVVEQIVEKGIDLTQDYNSWMEIGMCFSVFGEAGRQLFHEVSQFHENYRSSETNKKFDNFIRTSNFKTAAKFFKMAKERGIKVRSTVQAPAANAKGAEGVITANWTFKPPDDKCEITEEVRLFTSRYDLMEYNNAIWFAKYEWGQKEISYEWKSNYVIKPLFLILSSTDPKRLFEIRNQEGVTAVIDLPAGAMVSIQKFCEFMESKGNFLIEISKSQFFKLKRRLYDYTKNAEEVKILGYHRDGFYSFSNGLWHNQNFYPIDDYGMVSLELENDEDGESYIRNYFLAPLSSIYKDEEDQYQTEKKFIFKSSDTVTWKKWSTLFCQLHKENGHIALMWYLAAIFRDIVHQKFKFFPHLFGFGQKGTGKSLLGWSLVYMFGRDLKPFNLNAGTGPGFYRTFAQFRNAVTWFDEYKNHIDLKRIEDLKNAYDGAGHVKGDWGSGGNSTKTISTPVNSGCYISGQELPILDNALLSRVILLQFTQTVFSAEEAKLKDEMSRIQEPVLSHITANISSLRDKVEEGFDEAHEVVIKELKEEFEGKSVEERTIMNGSIPLVMYKILSSELEFPFSYQEIRDSFIKSIREQNALISKAKETSQFWDTVQYMLHSSMITTGKDFTIKNQQNITVISGEYGKTTTLDLGDSKEILYLSMSRIYPLYREALRKQGDNRGMDKNSLAHYLQTSVAFLGNIKTVRFGNWSSSAIAFDHLKLQEIGYDFHSNLAEPSPNGQAASDGTETKVVQSTKQERLEF